MSDNRQLLQNQRPLEQEPGFSSGIGSFIDKVTDRVVPTVPQRVALATGESNRPISTGAKENSDANTPIPQVSTSVRLTTNASAAAVKKPPSQPKLAYGGAASKTSAVSFLNKQDDHDINDRVHGLQGENMKLKEKENLLEQEIKKMQTKLHRIDELMMKSRGISGSGQDSDHGRLMRELEDQFGNFNEENSILKERVRKLKTVLTGLSQQMQGPPQKKAVKAYNPKPSSSLRKSSASKRPSTSQAKHSSLNLGHHSISGSMTMSNMHFPPGTSAEQKRLIEDMRLALQKNLGEIARLEKEKERYQGSTGHVTVDDMLRKIRERDSELRDISHQFDSLEADFIKKEKIFIDSKVYMEEIIKQIQEAKINNDTLRHKNIIAHMQFSQTKSLQDQLRGLDGERQTLENSIRRITSEPFLNREKGEGAQSALKRIADLEQSQNDKEKAWRTVKETEHKKEQELKALMPQIDRLRAECDVLKKENDKIKSDFTKNAEEFKEFDVYHTLFKLDATKYAEAIGDMNQRKESYPIWSEIDFLERPQTEGGAIPDPSKAKTSKELKEQIGQLRLEIMKLRQENKDFAAELEKSQNLLKLQGDIEKDNNKYYENEKERLAVMQRSIQLKAEELVRRADEKDRQLSEINKKLGLAPSTLTASQVNALPKATGAPIPDMDTQSEFSAVTNESEIKPEENVLDMAIQDAEYYYDAFKSVLDEKEMLLHQKTLVTFVTIDFYNHDTETSQLAEGFRPLYNTQFSFKNRIDDFYVQYLQKNTVKIDVYISKNNSAIHLGHAEVFLRDLIERETPLQNANTFKTPIITKPVRIFAARNSHTNTEQHLGVLKLKMRLRRPVGEAVRYFREKNEIETLKAMDLARTAGSTVSMQQRKKMITIQVVGAKELKVKYGDVANVSPFFYYQFYDFDERYSATAIGKSPLFEDTQNYEVLFDAKMVNYLQRENLEIILFDDNAPITGNDRGSQAAGEQSDDMIGSVLIPLGDLVKGASIHDRYPIRKIGGGRNATDSVGTLEVKMSIVDVDNAGTIGHGKQSLSNASQALLHYNSQWEKDLVYRIAKRLATIPGEVELHFGIFAKGQRSVTKEDFKYTCLKTLRLNKEITEKEMDMFIHGCPRLLDKQHITHEDFVMLFSANITQARHDIMDENAMKLNTIAQYNQTMARNTFKDTLGGDGNVFREGALSATRGNTTMNFSEQEIVEILGKLRAAEHGVVQRLKQMAGDQGLIQSDHFIAVMVREGNVSQFDSGKVATFFGNKNGEINLMQFVNYLAQATHIQALNSPAVQKFIKLVQSGSLGESVTRAILAQDIDKDGFIGLDGFKAAVLSPEYGFRVDEAAEAFHLLSREGVFSYKDFLVEKNPALKNLIMGSVRALSSALSQSQLNNRSESQLLESGRNTQHQTSQILTAGQHKDPLDMSLNESRLSLGGPHSIQHLNPSLHIVEDSKMRMIKNKLKDYLTEQDITLETLFKLIDTNSDTVLTISEFKQKMKALQIPLDDSELSALFTHIDRAQKGTIDYQGFVQVFPEVNISYMLKKIKTILRGSRVDEEMVFNEFCTDRTADITMKKLNLSDFKRFVKKYIEKAADFEIEMLFKHFASDPVAELTKSLTFRDFKEAFGREVRELNANVACSIEDIIKPLATKIRLYKTPVNRLFEKYDKNQNRRLSAEELAYAFKQDMNMDLQEDEVNAIREYFRNKHNSNEIGELDFIGLLSVTFKRTFDEVEAKKCLSLLKNRVYQGMGRTALSICLPFDTEDTKKTLSLRNFKHALHSLKVLTQYQVDNLTKYLDQNDDGFIMIDLFDSELRNATNMVVGGGNAAAGASFGRASSGGVTGGQTTQKWKKQPSNVSHK